MTKVFLILCSFSVPLSGAQVNNKPPAWTLQDVNGVTYKSEAYAGHTLLLIGGDKHSLESNNAWGERALNACGGSFSMAGVADTSAAPRFFRTHVKNELREGVVSRPASLRNVPLLLDWEGTLSHALQFKANVSNVVLLDPHGFVRFSISGPVTDEGIGNLCTVARGLAAAH